MKDQLVIKGESFDEFLYFNLIKFNLLVDL